MAAKIKSGDTVMIMVGREKGKQGKVSRVIPKEQRLIVEGHNLVRRHQKARGVARQAGIIEKEAPIHVSNVMVVCPNCGKPTRVGFFIDEAGRKSRQCKKCEGVFD
ncbi:MAG: 50S ribosomal protein L24 [Dehalococcoidia bacterium]|nr:MAG: 50S ribosomal protein L24 [Dehalococcoidia bacterium]